MLNENNDEVGELLKTVIDLCNKEIEFFTEYIQYASEKDKKELESMIISVEKSLSLYDWYAERRSSVLDYINLVSDINDGLFLVMRGLFNIAEFPMLLNLRFSNFVTIKSRPSTDKHCEKIKQKFLATKNI